MKIQESTVQLSASHEASRSQTLEVSTEQSFRRIFTELATDTNDARQQAGPEAAAIADRRHYGGNGWQEM